MNQDYRSDLAAAQARIVELEAGLAGHGGDITALEREHAALVRSVPTRARAWLIVGPSLVVAAMTLVPLLRGWFVCVRHDMRPLRDAAPTELAEAIQVGALRPKTT